MKTRFMLAVVSCGLCWGQAADDCKPSTLNVPGAQYPCVYSDNRVAFRLAAPDAQKVQVRLGKAYDMVRGADGMWSVAIPPQVVGFHYYTLVVDGVTLADPATRTFFGSGWDNSGIEIAEQGADYYSAKDVAHGEVRQRWYFSKVTGKWRRCYVYTPPDYDSNVKARYPVLYLLHGWGENEQGWHVQGHVDFIMDNLIAAKQAKPMLIVMPLGYGTMEIVQAGWQRVRSPELWQRNVDKFRESLLEEVLPQVEQCYRVVADRNSRAIAGLSMGGAESLMVGLNALDRFAWIGAFSTGGLNTNYPVLFPALNEKASRQLRLLWLGCGEQDGLLAGNQKLSEWLTSQGIRHTWLQTPGQHSFRVWRRYLAEFTPLLFQDKKRN